MKRLIFCCILGATVIYGCSGTFRDLDSEARAEYHMASAESLRSVASYPQALLEYRLVIELYPHTSRYPVAVRNAALLYSNPMNEAMDDSASLYWFQHYLALPISKEERTRAEIYVTMLKRITALRKEIALRRAAVDSLQAVVRKQTTDLSTRTKRVQDLETELQQATSELEKLRDVDIRINKRKGKK